MKALSSVVAIIMLLLISVALVGGFYWLYRSMQEAGESGGQTMSEIPVMKIQTVAEGNVWVRNVGAGTIDLSTARVYVKSQPVDFTLTKDSIAPGEMAGFELLENPCTRGTCQVRVAAAGVSDSREVSFSELSAS